MEGVKAVWVAILDKAVALFKSPRLPVTTWRPPRVIRRLTWGDGWKIPASQQNSILPVLSPDLTVGTPLSLQKMQVLFFP